MKPQFSEFTYGYALIEEMSKNYRFKSVPTFPTLVEEGRVGGYDVALDISGTPIFLQFKRSDYLSTANAKYYKYFSSKYYRFNLHALKHSKQHNLLLALERKGELVFYVAPKFHSQSSLHRHYFSSGIIKNSIWVSPLAIGSMPDNNEHSICFNKSASLVYFCSEPRKIELPGINQAPDLDEYFSKFSRSYSEALSPEEQDSNVAQPRSIWEETFESLSSVLEEQQPGFASKVIDSLSGENSLILKTAKMAKIGFGLDMLLIDPVNKSKHSDSVNAAGV